MDSQQFHEQIALRLGYTLPKGVRFEECGLSLPDDLPFEDWKRILDILTVEGWLIGQVPGPC